MQNGYYLNKTGDRVNQLLSRHFVVPTLSTVPDETTLNWQDGEYTVSFRIGELCRTKVNDKYKFYRLTDISTGLAIWKEDSGSGSVEIISEEEYEQLIQQNTIIANCVYLIIDEANQPKYLYIGRVLIAQKDGDVGFAYSFPIIF